MENRVSFCSCLSNCSSRGATTALRRSLRTRHPPLFPCWRVRYLVIRPRFQGNLVCLYPNCPKGAIFVCTTERRGGGGLPISVVAKLKSSDFRSFGYQPGW